jgi:hypothetical protein
MLFLYLTYTVGKMNKTVMNFSKTAASESILLAIKKRKNIRSNHILHTAWLDSHTLTLNCNTAKYHLGEKSSCLNNFLNFIL